MNDILFPSDLQKTLENLFMDDEVLNSYNIEALNNNGVVTLTGLVGSPDERERAEAMTKAIDGVTTVINELKLPVD